MEINTFSDIFDMESLQKLINSLSAAFRISLSIRNPKGERLAQDSNYGGLLDGLSGKEDGKELPVEDGSHGGLLDGLSGKEDGVDNRREEFLSSLCAREDLAPGLYDCESLGLTVAAVPIFIGNTHAASLLAQGPGLSEREHGGESGCILDLLSLIMSRLAVLGEENRHLKSAVSSLKNQESLHRREKDALELLAEADSMTGLYNRRKFEEVVSVYALQKTRKICMISGDANFLKLTNDIFGHDAGDLLLKTIAKIMHDLAKDSWLVARCGGDEFRVILPDATLETALDYCRRVARDCSRDKSLTLPLSVALGAAEWDSERETLQDCFSRADVKMYQNKTALKHELRVPHYIMERLYDRQILNREVVEYTTRMALEFALYLGLTQEQANEISMAAQYQDMGMAKLPESVVILGQCKTAEETSQIRMHASYSYTMARQFDELYKIADIIHCSHENWAGGSYPSGLKGEQIPLEARIIHIVSDYCEWTHPAAIARYCTREEAIRRLAEDNGVIYDPNLVHKYIKFLDKTPL
ncbi:MAG: diguanylate cyclase [Lachnospiraceae bacterium]|nr:diguanylate cyclase [Lachnospiraceae bacterium]